MAFETLKTIYNILREKEAPQAPIGISLDELCQIWLPYNNSFQSPTTAEERSNTTTEVSGTVETETGTPEAQQEVTVQAKEEAPVQAETVAPVEAEKEARPISADAAKRNIELHKFYDEVIQPNNDLLTNQSVIEGINKVIKLLDEYGDCPSIIIDSIDTGDAVNPKGDDIFKKVTLRNHTFNVTRLAVRYANDVYRETSGMHTVVIIAALCHDIGKIPELYNDPLYSGDARKDHVEISVKVLDSIFNESLNPHMLGLAKNAVRNHHIPTTDQLAFIIKKADTSARDAEIGEIDKSLSAPAWDTWFDPKALLERIRPHVNVIQTNSMWRAFSLGDIVYCNPSFLYEEASKMSIEKKYVVMPLTQKGDKDTGLQMIVESMRKANLLSDELGKMYVTRRYDVQTEQNNKKMNLVPVKLAAFDMPEEITRLKETYPQIVKGVRPC